MTLKIFDGENEIEMTRQEVTELADERAAEIYFANEIYRSEIKKLVESGAENLAQLLEEINTSADFLLTSLASRFGEEKAFQFAAQTSLMIILEENESDN